MDTTTTEIQKIEVPTDQLMALMEQNKEMKEALSGAINIISIMKSELIGNEDLPDFEKIGMIEKLKFAGNFIGKIQELNKKLKNSNSSLYTEIEQAFNKLVTLKKYLSDEQIKKIN